MNSFQSQNPDIKWHKLYDQYSVQRYQYIKIGEGLGLTVYPKESALFNSDLYEAYVDTKGIATIGVGFNLQGDAMREAVIGEIYRKLDKSVITAINTQLSPVITKNYTASSKRSVGQEQSIQLRKDIEQKLEIVRQNYPDSDIESFKFSSEDQVKSFFNTNDAAAPKYERDLDARFIALGIPLLPTDAQERIAILSMVWNGGPGIIGEGMQNALLSNNRALVWYEIRYNSNKSDEPTAATRRYFESDLFGLYDNRNYATLNEAINIASMYNAYRNGIIDINGKVVKKSIDAYDDKWDGKSGSHVGEARKKYQINNLVYNRRDDFIPALRKLSDIYPESLGAEVPLADYIPINTTVETNKLEGKDDNEVMLGGNGDDIINGNEGNDVLIGGPGNDQLNGGIGDDTILGGSGNDVMDGGEGFDRYVHIDEHSSSIAESTNPGKDIIINDTDGVVVTYAASRNAIRYGGYASTEGDYYPNPAQNGYIRINTTINNNKYPDKLFVQQLSQILEIGNNQVNDVNAAGSLDPNDKIVIDNYSNGKFGINLLPSSCRDAATTISTKSEGTITGTCGSDILSSEGTKSVQITAGSGNDTIITGNNLNDIGGNDTILAGTGNDNITTGSGNDIINGGDGSDSIQPQAGNDIVHGDAGDDFVLEITYTSSHTDNDVFYGDDGNDTIQALWGKQAIYGGEGNDTITIQDADGTAQENILDGGDGGDILTVYDSNVTMTGGPGVNIYNISYDSLADGKTVIIKGAKDSPHSIIYIGTTPIEAFGDITKIFNKTEKAVHISLTPEDSTILSHHLTTSQASGEIVVEDFYEGMLGIEGVEGAPPAPEYAALPPDDIDEPSTPIQSDLYNIYTPIIVNGDTIPNLGTSYIPSKLHLQEQHINHQAYTETTSFAMGAVLGTRVLSRSLPPRILRPIHRAFHIAQIELDLVTIHLHRILANYSIHLNHLRTRKERDK